MIYDQMWAFDIAAAKNITAAANSTNVHDAGSAKNLFVGSGCPDFRIAGWYFPNSGTNVTMRVQFVGADDAALTSNVITLADTGVSPVLTNTTPYPFELTPFNQFTAKRYYGLIYTPGGTTPNVDVMAGGTLSGGQNAYPARKAAVP